MYTIKFSLRGELASTFAGTLVKEGGNALIKVDLGVHCDKGHKPWSFILYYQLTYWIGEWENSLEGLVIMWLRKNKGESEENANGQCLCSQMCAIQILLSSQTLQM